MTRLYLFFIVFAIPFFTVACAELDGKITENECVSLIEAIDMRIDSGDKIFTSIKAKCARYALK